MSRCKEAEEGAAVAVASARDEADKTVAREKEAASEALRAAREEADRARALVKQVQLFYTFHDLEDIFACQGRTFFP